MPSSEIEIGFLEYSLHPTVSYETNEDKFIEWTTIILKIKIKVKRKIEPYNQSVDSCVELLQKNGKVLLHRGSLTEYNNESSS